MLNKSLKEFSYQIDYINKIIQVYINEKKIKGRVNNQENLLKVFLMAQKLILIFLEKTLINCIKYYPKKI